MDYIYLKRLIEAPSPSGSEQEALKVFSEIMPKTYTGTYKDKMGNLAYIYGHGPKKLLLSAHIDEVQARVSHISDEGIISLMNTGGICKKSLVASKVQIINDYGKCIDGIVEKKPIHCESEKERKEVGDFEKLKINIGCETKREVEELRIHPGSIVVYKRDYNLDFGKNQMYANAFDDKIGVFICEKIISLLHDNQSVFDNYTIIVLAATQEETGLRGATVAARNLNPDISIDFDVTFATDGGGSVDKEKYGEIKLGKGGVIQFGPDKSEGLNIALADFAKRNNIPFQYGVSRAGGTNTDAIQLNSADCETTLISIPNRNMHTPVEVVDKRDVESIIKLVSEAIKYNIV